MFAPTELLWALIGLILTIAGTWLEVFITSPPWNWGEVGVQALSLGVSFQVGAVLLIGCLGGKNAAALAQIAYLALGLVLFRSFEFQVFTQGGGIGYVREPTFGFLLGFIPAAWICGFLAFRTKLRLEMLALGCVCGLLVIHVCGLAYLLIAYGSGWATTVPVSLREAILVYSIYRIPGQLAVTCAVSVIAFVVRQLMFY
ncbi:biotin transporter BioY [Sphaerothrix gracilis]|uniref:biotin transporter BioY n=1 Tax=Sphaerothrix gracilis TaxID=3151835 RepID=UPI0031FDA04E